MVFNFTDDEIKRIISWSRILFVRSSLSIGTPNTGSSLALALTDYRKSVILRVPLVSNLSCDFTCLIRPLDGVAYVTARMLYASREDFALAINEMILDVMDPMIALRIS